MSPNLHLLIFILPNDTIVRLGLRIDSVDGEQIGCTWWRIGDVDPRACTTETTILMAELLETSVREIVCGRPAPCS